MPRSQFEIIEGGNMDKEKAIEAALSQIERAFGKGSIMRLGENKTIEIESIPSGSLGLMMPTLCTSWSEK